MRAAVPMAMPVTVPAADLLYGQLRQLLTRHALQVVGNCSGLRLVYPQALLPETREGAGADATDGNGIDNRATKGLERLAGTMPVAEIAIDHFIDKAGFGVNDEKHRRRAEVIEDPTVQTVILCNRKTDFHDDTSLFCVYAHYIRAIRKSTDFF